MAISLPGASKRLSGLLGRKRKDTDTTTARTARKQLKPQDVARLFDSEKRNAKVVRPKKLNDAEKQDSARLGSLRGALYSED